MKRIEDLVGGLETLEDSLITSTGDWEYLLGSIHNTSVLLALWIILLWLTCLSTYISKFNDITSSCNKMSVTKSSILS